MADLRPRFRRHALLAADANHAGERRPAQGRVGVSHAAGRASSRRSAARAARQARRGGEAPKATRRSRRRAAAAAADAAGSGFRPSEVTPLVIDGIMYLSTPYSRVVAVDPTTGKELWAFQLPAGSPSTRGVEYWPGDAQTPAQIVFGSSDGKLYSLDAKTGKPNDGFRRQRRRQPEYAGDHAGAARPQRAELAADRLQEPGDHRRHDAGESAEGSRGRRARLGHAHRQAGVDVPFDSARRREVQRHLGAATAGRIARA